MYTKTQPNISYASFLKQLKTIQTFTSVRGAKYRDIVIANDYVKFIRESSGREWKMDLRKVHQAYLEVTEFKTINFKPYIPRKQSPALGLLLSVGLVKKEQ